MKYKAILAAACLSLSSLAQAGVAIYLPNIGGFDMCDQIAGHWVGGGTVKKWPLRCHYSGEAQVSLVSAGKFLIDIKLHKDDGICPNDEAVTLPGNCANGVFQLKTDAANLDGRLSNDATIADLSGTIIFSGITVNVDDMHLEKKA